MPVHRCFVLLVIAGVAACGGEPAPEQPLAALRVSSVLGETSAEGFALAEAVPQISFPRDHGAHPDFRSEWWYLTAVLKADDGREFGVQWTLFRQALAPKPLGEGPWLTAQAYMAHLAVSDVARGRHLHASRLARGHPDQAGVETQPFVLHIEDWQVTGRDGEDLQLRLEARDAGHFAVTLDLQQTQAPILQGEGGLSKKGAGQASYYYSIPRMRTSGTIEVGAAVVDVSGWTWFDREWSTSVLNDELAGWDWFALQLDDGRDVMAFQLRRHDGKRDLYDYAMVREAGSAAQFGADGFELIPTRFWRDEDGVSWPVAWRLQIDGDEALEIEALIDNQVMDVGFRYWEGIVRVSGAGGDVGRGYMELTGYGEEM